MGKEITSKVTGLRLTEEARAVLERVSDEARFSQGDFVSALLELHGKDLDAAGAKVREIRERRKVYDKRGSAAMGLSGSAWTSYAETWTIDDNTEHVVTWTRGEIEQFADKFVDYNVIHDLLQHWADCNDSDKLRVENDFFQSVIKLPLPVRWRVLQQCYAVMQEHFTVEARFGEGDEDVEEMILPPMEDMVIDTFNGLPFPTSNTFRGVKIGMRDQLTGTYIGDFQMGVITDMFNVDDWSRMMEAIDTGASIAVDKMFEQGLAKGKGTTTVETKVKWPKKGKYSDGCAQWPIYTKEERMNQTRSTLTRIAKGMGKPLDRVMKHLLPQPYEAIFGNIDRVHDAGEKSFSLKDGPFPRSKALHRIAACLLVGKEFDVVVTVKDLYEFAGCAKSQVSQLLKDWAFFFDRHSDENGPKRNGYIRLSSVGYDYFTPAECVIGGDLPNGFMSNIVPIKKQTGFPLVANAEKDHWAETCRSIIGS